MRRQHPEVVVAEYALGIAVTEDLDGLIAEAELLDHDSGAQQLVDRAHPFQRQSEPAGVAMNVGHNPDPHSGTPFDTAFATADSNISASQIENGVFSSTEREPCVSSRGSGVDHRTTDPPASRHSRSPIGGTPASKP